MKLRLGGDSHPNSRPLMMGTTRTVGTTGIISSTGTVGTTDNAVASHGCLQQLCMSPPTSE